MSEAVSRTWDGLEIASRPPTGGTVCVRRTTPAAIVRCCFSIAATREPTTKGTGRGPARPGVVFPARSSTPAVLRELAEEAGLEGYLPWAVDLSGRWACFAVDVPYDVTVDLVDPEHDRYEWVSPSRAVTRMLPSIVGEQQARAAAVPSVDLAFRPMTDEDFGAVARWQSAPHVATWWDPRTRDEDSVRARYAPRLRGDEPDPDVGRRGRRAAAGFLQDYRVGDHPDYAVRTQDPDAVAFDYAIGEPGRVGRGLGTRMIWEFCRDVLRARHPDAVHFLASPSHRNVGVAARAGQVRLHPGPLDRRPRASRGASRYRDRLHARRAPLARLTPYPGTMAGPVGTRAREVRQPRTPHPALRRLVTQLPRLPVRRRGAGVHHGLPSTSLTVVLAFDRPLDVGWWDDAESRRAALGVGIGAERARRRRSTRRAPSTASRSA